MNKQINKLRQSLLLLTIAIVMMLGATSSAFAQKAMTAKFPKPDFSAMEEYWEIVEYEYDYASSRLGQFIVVAKKKQAKVPTWWDVAWKDAQGVKLHNLTIYFNYVNVRDAKVGDTLRGSSYAPDIRNIPKIKSVVVTESEDPHWVWNNVDANNTFIASLFHLNRFPSADFEIKTNEAR